MGTATASGNRKAKRGKLRAITVRPADNGFVVEVDHHPHDSTPEDYPKHETSVHTDPAACLACIGKAMGHEVDVEDAE